ncbi:MAG: hypothetical protein ACRENP_12900 [Longimicrobiales bacterium]
MIMTLNFLAFLIGLFVVPLLLLSWGRRLRRRAPRSRSAFWGAIIGHCVAGTIAVIWGMIPPEAWTAEETGRGFFGLWSLLVLPLAGALVGALFARAEKGTEAGPQSRAPVR